VAEVAVAGVDHMLNAQLWYYCSTESMLFFTTCKTATKTMVPLASMSNPLIIIGGMKNAFNVSDLLQDNTITFYVLF
jgi:hypothetical protein